MTHRKLALASLALLSLGGCQTAYESAASQIGSAAVVNRAGDQVGIARLYSLADEVTINVSFSGMTAGVHAVHLHTSGDCSAADFTSAGGHLNPGGNQHGTRNPLGAHLGDLPNVTIDGDGNGTVSALLRGTRETVMDAVFDADGTAIVVHERADDYRTDPTGDAGGRVACGTIAAG